MAGSSCMHIRLCIGSYRSVIKQRIETIRRYDCKEIISVSHIKIAS